jgi:hypothetical protein
MARARMLADCTGRDGWPRHGVYFFFEGGENRADGSPRVVRVGTYALRLTVQQQHRLAVGRHGLHPREPHPPASAYCGG